MRAIAYDRTGAARDVLRLVELPEPEPAPGEVRVRLQWSGVNPSDVKSRAGLRNSRLAFPQVVPHSDGMGVIDKVGPGVDAARLGEAVWVWNGAWGRAHGTAAEAIALPAVQAVPLPPGVAGDEAACFGIPALTAMHAVLAGGGVQGRTVLVAGGAGAVGHHAVQFAKRLGAARVIASVSSAAKAAIAREAGADEVVDYRAEDLKRRVADLTNGEGVDRVIEVDIAANGLLDPELTRVGGDWCVYGSGAEQFALPFFGLITRNVTARFFIVYRLDDAARAAAIGALQRLLAAGQVATRIAHRLPLADAAQAHELVERGAIGNVVLHIA